MTGRHGVMRTFAWPLILAASSLAGLTGALFWDGIWDGLGAVLLGLCLVMPLRRARR